MAARAARPRWRRLPVERNEEYAIVFGPAEKFRRTMEDVPVKTDCRFRAFEHVRLKREFDRVFQEGRAFELREISVRALPNGLGHARLGLCVGKRHGNAVRRNRIKRLLRGAYRLNRHGLTVPCDLVIVPRTTWRNLTLAEIEPVFREALSRIGKVFAPR